ncbi:hypothetical protein [Kineococcus aurantiacus]|uniref:Uncharacterized protein n=1 Tax=Kineococcus aurantiacus TaxID=37633 RepID=A0A7Y9ATQ8_9ACTN|nr:hypothetical protein [Kineococcus aurantiacus]NYD21589.1 hypothetical protein [Kineococcus aurantiacus]
MTHEGSLPADTAHEPVMEMLSEHIPLSLIMDMVSPDGPHSAELLAAEGLPDQEWWKQG